MLYQDVWHKCLIFNSYHLFNFSETNACLKLGMYYVFQVIRNVNIDRSSSKIIYGNIIPKPLEAEILIIDNYIFSYSYNPSCSMVNC